MSRIRTIALAVPLLLYGTNAAAQLNAADRASRCENNRRQMTEIEAWTRANVSYDEDSLPRAQRIVEALNHALEEHAYLSANQDESAQTLRRAEQIEGRILEAVRSANAKCDANMFVAECGERVVSALETAIASSIRNAAELARRKEQYRYHRNRLAELGCDQAYAGPVAAGPPAPAPAAAAASSGGCIGFMGKWNTSYGPITLRGSPDFLRGSYDWNGRHGDTIEGRPQNGVLEGSYDQPGYPNPNFLHGRIRFTLSADGNSFSGTWTDVRGAVAGTWSGTCAGRS